MYELLLQLAARGGPIGICLALCFLYIRSLNNQLRETEALRANDVKSMIQKLLTLNDKWNETINTQMDLTQAQQQAFVQLQESIKNLNVAQEQAKLQSLQGILEVRRLLEQLNTQKSVYK